MCTLLACRHVVRGIASPVSIITRSLHCFSNVQKYVIRRSSTSEQNHHLVHRDVNSDHRIAVGMSGGVDSSVAAALLKQDGWDVHGFFMRNWDEKEEQGTCTSDADYAQVKHICQVLGIPCQRVDFVSDYWNEVFSPTLTAYENGLTPNPDVLCNTYVKFSSFSKYVEQLGFKWMATGHYARKIHYSPNGDSRSEQPKLFLRCALDKCKDQTYFLAGINSNSIQRTLFPIGDMYKCDVKALAARLGLKDVAAQKESMGMCFVGKRKLSAFLREYTNASFYGRFTDVDSGKDIGFNDNALLLTIGQRARIPACTRSYYVVGKNMDDHVVFVARGADHPMLSCTIFGIAHPVWTSDECIQQLVNQECSDVAVRIRHRGTMAPCRLRLLQGDREHVSGCLAHDKPHHVIHLRNYTKNKHLQLGEKGIKATPSSSFLQHNLSPKSSFGARPSLQPLDQWNLDAAVQRNSHRLSAIVECKQPIRGVAPGQHAVFYTHDVCLGRGEISCVYYGSAKLPSISWSNREAITTKLHSLDCQ